MASAEICRAGPRRVMRYDMRVDQSRARCDGGGQLVRPLPSLAGFSNGILLVFARGGRRLESLQTPGLVDCSPGVPSFFFESMSLLRHSPCGGPRPMPAQNDRLLAPAGPWGPVCATTPNHLKYSTRRQHRQVSLRFDVFLFVSFSTTSYRSPSSPLHHYIIP